VKTSQADTTIPVQHMQGAGAVNNAAAAAAEAQPAAAPQQAAAHPQQPAHALPQPGAAAAGAGLQFGNAPPGIDPAMWASLDAATASAIQVTQRTLVPAPSGVSLLNFMFYCVFVLFSRIYCEFL